MAINLMRPPTIKRLLEIQTGNGRRYRVEGGDLREDWAKSVAERGVEPWSEIVVGKVGDGCRVLSFGGSVWPSAWPAFFEDETFWVAITPAGLEALDAADREVA